MNLWKQATGFPECVKRARETADCCPCAYRILALAYLATVTECFSQVTERLRPDGVVHDPADPAQSTESFERLMVAFELPDRPADATGWERLAHTAVLAYCSLYRDADWKPGKQKWEYAGCHYLQGSSALAEAFKRHYASKHASYSV